VDGFPEKAHAMNDMNDESAEQSNDPTAALAGSTAQWPEPDLTDPTITGFAALGLRPELLKAINDLGYEEPTPIQRETIPHLIAGHDLLGQAATGTGKTAAFALPALQSIDPSARVEPSVLVLVPTRELAVQVSEAMFKYGRELGVKVVPIFGGQPIQRQLQALDRGVHVVVATPGRAIDHIGRGSLKLDAIRTVILDEADEMLDMGFTDDIESILQSTPDDRQTVLFSATLPHRINSIAKRYQRDPVKIKIGRGDAGDGEKVLVRQTVYWVQRAHKASALGRILDIEAPQSALVFCRTRTEVDQLTETMNGRGYRAEALHGGMDQSQRDRVMSRLRDGTAELLVATDVAARGLDVDTLSHVVNYDVPSAAESYVHRIGRVGRAGREGVAITLAEPRDRRQLENIERLTKQTILVAKVPSVADLRARQIELTVSAVRESLASPDLEDYNSVLHALAGESSDRNIALAAIKLVHEHNGTSMDEQEIPDASERARNDGKGRKNYEGKSYDGKSYDGKRAGGKSFDKGERAGGKGGGKSFDKGERGARPTANGDTGFVYVSLGRKGGVRPGDLVGAIANETGLSGREIGPIRITDNFSVVGVPAGSVDTVVSTMGSTTLRGKKAKVRRYTD
jgi:ATP-dependent RNA helicase DeaD